MKVAVSLSFETTTFNRTFTQCLRFDFGKKPYLIQGLNVDIANEETLRTISAARQKLNLDTSVWTEGSVDVVSSPAETTEMSTRDRLLLTKYRLPERIENVVSVQVIDGNVTVDNYKRVMHQLLFTEEIFMKKAISRYLSVDIVTITNKKTVIIVAFADFDHRVIDLPKYITLRNNIHIDLVNVIDVTEAIITTMNQ